MDKTTAQSRLLKATNGTRVFISVLQRTLWTFTCNLAPNNPEPWITSRVEMSLRASRRAAPSGPYRPFSLPFERRPLHTRHERLVE